MASLVQVNKGEGVTFQNPIEDEDEDKDENKKKKANDRGQKIETNTMEMKSKMMLYLAGLLQVAPAQPQESLLQSCLAPAKLLGQHLQGWMEEGLVWLKKDHLLVPSEMSVLHHHSVQDTSLTSPLKAAEQREVKS